MSTRGIFGFRVGGQDKLSYNHCDSYPEGLGADILHDLKKLIKHHGIGYIIEKAEQIKIINENVEPTVDDVFNLRAYTDLSVGRRSTKDWYCLTRKLQGDIATTLEAGYMHGDNNFINESLFCEWGYIINLDDNVLEVYKGFQHEPHKQGRYSKYVPPDKYPNGSKVEHKYYACALVAKFPLNKLPQPAQFTRAIKKATTKPDEVAQSA